MDELFETVCILSLLGFCLTAVLLFLKPVTSKKFPANWQYYVWIIVLISMITPIYKFVPKKEAKKLSYITGNEVIQQGVQKNTEVKLVDGVENTNTPVISAPSVSVMERIRVFLNETREYIACIWMVGTIIYIVCVIACYTTYIFRKRKNSFLIEDNEIFENTKEELGINRNIRLKISKDIGSPMLVGMVMPTIYIPIKDICDKNLRMVYLHELTHYKRKDLAVKWLSLFVNAVHWFNPLAYLLCANISEACEISCDMEVTRNMSNDERNVYMKTILDLAG